MAIYEHWVGTTTGRADPAAPRQQVFDHWIPSQALATAKSVGKNPVGGGASINSMRSSSRLVFLHGRIVG